MPTKDTTYKVVELIAEKPHLPDFIALLEVGPAGREEMLATAATMEGLAEEVDRLEGWGEVAPA